MILHEDDNDDNGNEWPSSSYEEMTQ